MFLTLDSLAFAPSRFPKMFLIEGDDNLDIFFLDAFDGRDG
jgi:hypothetical protein